MKDNYKVIDLFCGCGGFSKGFELAGFEISLGLDSWKDATVTYAHNFPNSHVIHEDIRDLDPSSVKSNYGLNDIDVIIGGPPCQGFSLSGKRTISDPRNHLYKSFVKYVGYFQPKIFVMENVPGIVQLFDGKVKDKIINDFSDLGYNVVSHIHTAADYGVPQIRRRVFFVGISKSNSLNREYFTFPQKTHGDKKGLIPYITSADAISDLDFIRDDVALPHKIDYLIPSQNKYQHLMRAGSSYCYNHVTTLHRDKTKSIISLVPDGGNYKDLPENLQDTRRVNIAWTRMNSKKPCFTIDTGHNHHFHYKENRVPTVRESARIQSFPDTFIFKGNKTSQLKQVGNAVPPLLAKVLADEIYKVLRKE